MKTLKHPAVQILMFVLVVGLIYVIVGRRTGIWFDIVDVVILMIAVPFWLFFFSQFVLPVRKLSDRLKAFERVMLYIFGGHGPAIFVENGAVRANEEEKERTGPGVIWLDTASAAVLRTNTKFTRTVGPGIAFTQHNEYLAEPIVDLHELSLTLGPIDGDNSFNSQPSDENYVEVQNRRWETSAMTRDGIEVLATILINFNIRPEPGSQNDPATPFGYSAGNVFKYVVANASNEIVSRMTVDVWREYLRKYRFNQLFESLPGQNITLLQRINQMLNARLNNEQVAELDEFGRDTNRIIDSPEYRKMLEMGLIGTAFVRRIILHPESEQKLVSLWTANWLKNAQQEHEQVERQRVVRTRMGQDKATREFAEYASQDIDKVMPRNQAETLETLVHGTLRGVLRNTPLQRRMTSEPHDLSDIIQWLRESREGQAHL